MSSISLSLKPAQNKRDFLTSNGIVFPHEADEKMVDALLTHLIVSQLDTLKTGLKAQLKDKDICKKRISFEVKFQ